MLEFVKKYGLNITSQNGENGIIHECLKRLKISKGVAVEFGAPDTVFCSNIHPLKVKGWRCIYFDPNPQEEGIIKAFITPENVNVLIPECDVLSIDIDGNDYEVWKAYEGQPDIIIIEVNSSFHPEVYHFSKEKGSSYSMMNKLAEEKGYFMLCHTGNCIFILNEHKHLFPEITLDPITNWEKFFNQSWLS